MEKVDWDNVIWNIIDSYFKNTSNYLSKHQIDSYNTFLNKNISKTIRQFNPIVLPYAKTVIGDSENSEYMFELRITVGGSYDKDNREVLNDGSSIFIGKPIIQEVKIDNNDNNNINIYQKTLYPNEARLKNITYKTEINVDIFVEMLVFNESTNKLESALEEPKHFRNVTLTRNLPIMLQSQACSLGGMQGTTLRLMGECEYDQGGYFIIDGKEKVIVAQERQIENKVYINENKPGERYKFNSEIRSAPENKFQPARITRCYILNYKQTPSETINEDTIRISIPNINGEVPLFIIYRALGVITDLDICNTIVDDIESPLGKKFLEFLQPTITEGMLINNQKDALLYLESKISSNFMTPSIDKTTRLNFLLYILRDYFLPHCGSNNYEKAYYLGYMVGELIYTRLNIRKKTDRDSYIYKRVDTSGFLISAIFRDLYFRVKNKLIENVNIAYSTKDDDNSAGLYWKSFTSTTNGYRDYNFLKLIAYESEEDGVKTIDEIFDESIMNEGFLYAFKNCWGLKNAPCKQGITQDMNRLSFAGAVSHIRRVNTPLSSSAKVRAPHMLHLSSYGYMCPYETPDGANIGLRKNISLFCNITSGTNSTNLIKLLYTSGLEDILQFEKGKLSYTRVFLNERLMGYTKKPLYMTRKLKLLKRNALINVYTSIAWYIDTQIIKISTDSGRAVRPVMVASDGKTKITSKIISMLDSKQINWYHLVGGFRNIDKAMPYDDNDGTYYATPENDNLEQLEETAGIIEYIDAEETNVSLIAMNPKNLDNKIDKYNYCEIHPSLSLGVLASMIPGVEMNQQPRNLFSTGQSKQALGMYATNYRNRMDTKGQIMYYPQKALVKNRLSKYLSYDELPHGINAIVALGCFSGYNQEDSIIFNKASVQRGLFRTAKFKTFSDREEIKNGVITEYICNPDPNTVQGIKSGNYSKLDDNGIVRENVWVDFNDVIVGKCVKTGSKDSDGNEIILDKSELVKKTEDGFIDKVYSNTGNDSQRYVKVRIRKEKIPEIGDKFTSRYGQKGTIGMLLDEENMPRTKDGIIPDMIVNTHAFPSRMTIAQFYEVLLGKFCVNKGILSEIVPFADIDVEGVAKLLQDTCGFEKYGNEILYSGIDGRQLNTEFFIGPTYYQRLTQQVSDKYQSRDDGSKTALTHQPVSGRALGGGGRLGEMERDAMLSHGISSFIKESFMERSDKFQFFISNKTGMISVFNPVRNIYRDFVSDETMQYVDHNNNIVKRPIDSSISSFSAIEAPYSFKLLLQEIESMGIALRLISQSIVQEWEKIDSSDIPTKFQKVEAEMREKLNQGYYKESDSQLTMPLRAFHNKIKLGLLRGSSVRRGALLDFACGRGGDLLKWYMSGYSKILGFDIDKEGIENIALKRIEDMRKSENENVKVWANVSQINLLEGDSSKLMSNGDISRNTTYEQKLADILKITKNNTFNTVSMQFAIHYLFKKEASIDNFFTNVKQNLLPGGYLIITTLDGPSVYNALKKSKSKTIKGYVFDNEKGEDVLVWKINAGASLNLDFDTLPSTPDNGFGNSINVMFESIGAEYEEYLVHPALLISKAAKNHLHLLDSYEVTSKFKLFNNSTGLFKDLYKGYYNHFESNEDIRNLDSRDYSELKQYSDMHRYYIFKYDADNRENFDNTQVRDCVYAKNMFYEQRYKIKIPTKTALDITLLNRYINEPRSLIGNVINKKSDKSSNRFMSQANDVCINNTVSRLENSFFKKIDDSTYRNTMEYVFKYIKIGIYVRIVNNALVQFTPMLNYGDKTNNVYLPDDDKKNIDFLFNDITSQDIVEYLNYKYDNSELARNWYNEKLNSTREKTMNDELDNRGSHNIIIDGHQVYIGNDIVNRFLPQYSVYRDMFETLTLERDKISNCEFIINMLNHPILKTNKNEIVHPYQHILGEHASNIRISGNVLPIVGPTMKDGYLDISIPTVIQWNLCKNTIIPPICNASNRYAIDFNDSMSDRKKRQEIAFILNLDGNPENNMRTYCIDNITQINQNIKKSGLKVVTKLFLDRIPNYVNNDGITFYDKHPNLAAIASSDNDYGVFPHKSSIIVYIDGNGSDDIFTKSVYTRCALLVLKNKDSSKHWYEDILESIDLSFDFTKLRGNYSEMTADYIEIDDLEDSLNNAVDLLVKNPGLIDALSDNKSSKITKFINNKDFIVDYLDTVVKGFGKNVSDKYVNENIFKNYIREEGVTTSIKFKEEYIGILVGKNGKNLKNIMNISNTDIQIPRSNMSFVEDGVKYLTIKISGGESSVMIAEDIVNKIGNSIATFVEVPKNKMIRLRTNRFEAITNIQKTLEVKIYVKLYDDEILKYLKDKSYVEFTNEYDLIKIVGFSENVKNAVRAIDILIKSGLSALEDNLEDYTKKPRDTIFEFNDADDTQYDSLAPPAPYWSNDMGYSHHPNMLPPPPVSGYVPKSPEFAPKSPEFSPKSPEFSPKSPEFAPKSPEFSPKSPYMDSSQDFIHPGWEKRVCQYTRNTMYTSIVRQSTFIHSVYDTDEEREALYNRESVTLEELLALPPPGWVDDDVVRLGVSDDYIVQYLRENNFENNWNYTINQIEQENNLRAFLNNPTIVDDQNNIVRVNEKYDAKDILIVVPYVGTEKIKGDDVSESRIELNEFDKKFLDYLISLDDVMKDASESLLIPKNYTIMVVGYANTTISNARARELFISDDIVYKKTLDQVILNFNKGGLYNMAGITAFLDNPDIKSIVFNEPFLVPNKTLAQAYFTQINTDSVLNLSACYDKFEENNKLGIFAVNKVTFVEKVSYPNHIWSYHGIDSFYLNMLSYPRVGKITIKNYIAHGVNIEDQYPDFHSFGKNIVDSITYTDLENCSLTSDSSYLKGCTSARQMIQNRLELSVTHKPFSERNIIQNMYNFNYNMLPISSLSQYDINITNNDSIDDIRKVIIDQVSNYVDNVLEIKGERTDFTYTFVSKDMVFLQRLDDILTLFIDTLKLNQNESVKLTNTQTELLNINNFRFESQSIEDNAFKVTINLDDNQSGGMQELDITSHVSSILEKDAIVINGKYKNKIGRLVKKNKKSLTLNIDGSDVIVKLHNNNIDETITLLDDLLLSDEDHVYGTVDGEFGSIVAYLKDLENRVVFKTKNGMILTKHSSFENADNTPIFNVGDMVKFDKDGNMVNGVIININGDSYDIISDNDKNLYENIHVDHLLKQ